MIILRGLMQEVLKCSNASISVLAELLKVLDSTSAIYVIRSIYLFDDMGERIMLILNHNEQYAGNEELKTNIRKVYQCASMLIEMDTKLLRNKDKLMSVDITDEFDTTIKEMQLVLCKAAWEVLRIFGPKEAVLIVSPGYQLLSGIWKEYRKTVLSIEA